MMNPSMTYNIIYALAAQGGNEGVLFGDSFARSIQDFEASCIGSAFPELWFEIPLMGKPWFDLHALTARESLSDIERFEAGNTGGYPDVFAWFARKDDSVRQLALSHDTGSSESQQPAIQLLIRDQRATPEFLRQASGEEAAQAYCRFEAKIPKEWFPCYTGLFPQRPQLGVRVECIPSRELQAEYAQDASLFGSHLQSAGLDMMDANGLEKISQLASMPFPIEFQFNIAHDGTPKPILGVSLRFDVPPGSPDYRCFEMNGPAGDLMRLLEAWGVADKRWQRLESTMYCKGFSRDGQTTKLYCYPAFAKLRWKDGKLLDAKSYLIAGVE